MDALVLARCWLQLDSHADCSRRRIAFLPQRLRLKDERRHRTATGHKPSTLNPQPLNLRLVWESGLYLASQVSNPIFSKLERKSLTCFRPVRSGNILITAPTTSIQSNAEITKSHDMIQICRSRASTASSSPASSSPVLYKQ